MAIHVRYPPEPLTGPPQPRTVAPVLASSRAFERLTTLIDRYCNRELAGRSILIAGHRGAGKTTLVKAAIETVRRRQASSTAPCLPLFVPLQGADLLGTEDVLGGDGTAGGKELSAPVRQALTSLRVLTIALHRAFMVEVGWAFEERMASRSEDLREIAAQLRLDLDGVVEPRDLRWVWKRAGVFDGQILRNAAPASYFAGQGSLEIVAIHSVIDAFTRAVAKVEASENSRSEAKLKQEQEIQKVESRKEILNAATGLLTGGIAGAGTLGSDGSVLLAALAFAVTTALTTALLNFSSSRSRSEARSRERSIQWNLSVASLDLVLPLVINRVVDAGRAPIFVIDELDKVDDLENKIEGLIDRLKHIVADKAFFCFLVDRPYFERMQSISRETPHRKEHTFFSERLFAVADPGGWHAYLKDVLEVVATSPADLATGELDRLGLAHVLLARSKMHAIDLQRELAAIGAGANGEVTLPAAGVRGDGAYRNMILVQAIVEFILTNEAIVARVERDPGFLQYAYDALYYLLDAWREARAPVIDEASVRRYLEARIRLPERGVQPGPPAVPPPSLPPPPHST